MVVAGGANSLLDGSVDHNNWFYAVGTSGEWSCGIPGAQDCESKGESLSRVVALRSVAVPISTC